MRGAFHVSENLVNADVLEVSCVVWCESDVVTESVRHVQGALTRYFALMVESDVKNRGSLWELLL